MNFLSFLLVQKQFFKIWFDTKYFENFKNDNQNNFTLLALKLDEF